MKKKKNPRYVFLNVLGKIEKEGPNEYLASMPSFKIMDTGETASEATQALMSHFQIVFEGLLTDGTWEQELKSCGLFYQLEGDTLAILEQPGKTAIAVGRLFGELSHQPARAKRLFKNPVVASGWIPLSKAPTPSQPPRNYSVQDRVLVRA